MKSVFRYIYGPVPSWRLGGSLGIDLLSQKEKICNFDCVYCQLGRTKGRVRRRKIYVPAEKIVGELSVWPVVKTDYLTFSGRGEPTLAANLGEAIRAVKVLRREPVAVLTNSSLMGLEDVREELGSADAVVAKLDAWCPDTLKVINRPGDGIAYKDIVEGIKRFRKNFKGRLALQMMFIEENRREIHRYAELARDIRPDEVQVNTPLRPCRVRPLAKEHIFRIKDEFNSACRGIHIVSVYDRRVTGDIRPVSGKDTLRRRGKVLS